MKDGTIILWFVAIVLGWLSWRRGAAVFRRGLADAGERLIATVPRVALAVLTAGFLGSLMPGEPVARLIGPDSGVFGILVASVAGGFVPSGPIVSFPLIAVLRDAGAGLPQLVAFLTAWSVFAFHRVLIYEAPLMGWGFSARRLGASLLLPPLSGFATAAALGVIRLAGGS